MARRNVAISGALLPALTIALLLLATGLRFYRLDAQSLWNDEGNSARLSERSLALIVEGTASDVHPPLYYLALRGWREMLGDSEFGLRSFSAFAGVLTVAATISLARLVFGGQGRLSRVAPMLVAALLAALNPALVYYSQEARMYALLALLAALSTIALWRWLDAQKRLPWAIAYVVLSTAGLYTHYSYPVMFVTQALLVFLWLVRQQITLVFSPLELAARPNWSRAPLEWLAMVAVSVLLYAPWVPTFMRQTGGRPSERAALGSFSWDSLRWMLFGPTITSDALILATVVALGLVIIALVVSGRRLPLPLAAVVIPIAAMFAAGTTNPAFYKFMLVAVPFLMICLAAAFVRPLRGQTADRAVRWSAVVLLLLLIGGFAVSLRNLYFESAFARADYRAMANAIAADRQHDVGVILDAPNQWEVFTYYFGDRANVYPLPLGRYEESVQKSRLDDIAARHDRLYVLFWGDDLQDPQRFVENWLDNQTFKASERWVGDVRFALYAVAPGLDENAPSTDASIIFDEMIRLQDYSLAGRTYEQGEVIPVILRWSADSALEQRYKVFLHLIDREGRLVAQYDSEPAGGLKPTISWQAGETVLDNQGLLLPENLIAGQYELLIGLYPVGEPEQRLEWIEDGRSHDTYSLGEIVVE